MSADNQVHSSPPLIDLSDITKTFRREGDAVPVLHGVSLSIKRGESIAFMGPSGSGKSTLLAILGLLDRPSSGSYHFAGDEVGSAPSSARASLRNSEIGFVFQSFHLLPRVSALDNVLLPTWYANGTEEPKQAQARAVESLTRLGLGDRLHHAPNALSGGQQQRVAIARALINEPSVLFADEPTGNLDSRSAREVLELLEEIHRERGVTLVIVTHDAAVAERAERIIEVRDGLLFDGEAERGK